MAKEECSVDHGGCGRNEDPRTGRALRLVKGLCQACRDALAEARAASR